MKDFYALGMWKCGRLGDQSCLVFFGQPNSPDTFVKFQKLLQNAFLLGPLFVTFQKRCLEKNRYLETAWKLNLGEKKKFLLWHHFQGGKLLWKCTAMLLKIAFWRIIIIFKLLNCFYSQSYYGWENVHC